MRLEVTARYLSKINPNRALRYIIFLLLVFSIKIDAQEYKFSFENNTPLSEALLRSSQLFHFKVAFDAQRLSKVYTGGEITGNSQAEFISNLLQNSSFTHLYKHGCFLIVEKNDLQSLPIIKECEFLGSVVDFETGEQLPFASIMIPAQNIAVSSSTNGTFSVKNVISNPMQVKVSYIGYDPVDTFLNWSGSSLQYTFRLKRKSTIIHSVDIKANKVNMIDYRGDMDFATTINPMKLIDLPLLVETDIFRTLQLLPGISYSENSSELSIRGGTSDQNLILFDGQTLYNLSHYYGIFSSVNPYIVKDIQVFKGGFDSRYGERISGVVDITGKSGNQMKPRIIADLNLLSFNLATEIPLSKKITLIAAGRRSYSDIYTTSFAYNLFSKSNSYSNKDPNETIITSEPSFYFYDLNGKVNYRISNNENLSLSLYGGKDYYKNSYESSSNRLSTSALDSNSWYNYGISASWQKQWNTSFFSNFIVGSSGYANSSQSKTNIEQLRPDTHDLRYLPDSTNVFEPQNYNELKDYSISMKNVYIFNNFNQLNFGFLVRNNYIHYHKDVDSEFVYDNIEQTSFISSAYAQDKISFLNKLFIQPGFRLSYYRATRQMYFEPRFAIKYNFSDHFSCRMATGQYNQFISQVLAPLETGYVKSFWILANDSVNPVLSANHLVLGMTYDTKSFLFDIEGYYKKYSGLQEYLYISEYQKNSDFVNYNFPRKDDKTVEPPLSTDYLSNDPSFFITGSGKSYGIDFLIRYMNRSFTSWISYSVSKNVQWFDSINHGDEIPALTDQRHQLSFSNLYTVGKWNFGAISLFSTGRPYIASTENENNLPVIRYYKRMPNYFRNDISVNYNFYIKSVNFKIGLSVINLFDTHNYVDVNTRIFDFENTTFSQINLIQSQKRSLNLFLHISL